jgi:hypothetical protein
LSVRSVPMVEMATNWLGGWAILPSACSVFRSRRSIPFLTVVASLKLVKKIKTAAAFCPPSGRVAVGAKTSTCRSLTTVCRAFVKGSINCLANLSCFVSARIRIRFSLGAKADGVSLAAASVSSLLLLLLDVVTTSPVMTTSVCPRTPQDPISTPPPPLTCRSAAAASLVDLRDGPVSAKKVSVSVSILFMSFFVATLACASDCACER